MSAARLRCRYAFMYQINTNQLSFVYACCAIALVLWQYFGMNNTVEIVPDSHTGIYLTNDANQGGRSVGQLAVANGVAQLDCTTRPSKVFAFCGFMLPIGNRALAQGIDFTQYSSLAFELSFESDVRDTVLIYLHSKQVHKGESRTRIHMHPIAPKPGLSHYQLELEDFFVPSWWLLYFAKDQSDSAVDLTNVVGFQLTTGDNRAVKSTQLALGKVRLTGKWISAGQLYFILLMGGLAILLVHSIASVLEYRAKYRASRVRSEELDTLNKLLSVERDKYENLSKTDPLTGCVNRIGARELFEQLVSTPPSGGPKASLILLDIDHFKDVNDTYGHAEGDRILVELTSYIRDHTRAEDTFVRWGGEEFAIICPRTSGQQARVMAEHLRTQLATAIHVQNKPITCSFGVAELMDSGVEAWFRRTDDALYQAKHDGRNRVVLAQ